MEKTKQVKPKRFIRAFKTAAEFRRWLKTNHAQVDEIWIRFFKKASGQATVTYAEALDEALCYGWIDGLVNSYDAQSWIHRFTPRRPKSGWSKRNREHVARLLEAGRMLAPGKKQIELAKADGRWDAAYDSPATAKPPKEFLVALKENEKAQAFFKTLNKANVYAICYQIQTAKKAETKTRRITQIVAKLARHEKFHG